METSKSSFQEIKKMLKVSEVASQMMPYLDK